MLCQYKLVVLLPMYCIRKLLVDHPKWLVTSSRIDGLTQVIPFKQFIGVIETHRLKKLASVPLVAKLLVLLLC